MAESIEQSSNVSNLLENMLSGGQITSEQWQTYKQIRSVGLICSDSDEDSSDSGETSAEINTSGNSATNVSNSDVSVQIAETSETSHTIWDSTSAIKFIDGKISFNELVDIMEKNDGMDGEEEIDPKESEMMFEKELNESRNRKKKRKSAQLGEPDTSEKPTPVYRSRRKLPRDLQGLVGEANMMLARGNHEEAIKMALEVIRQCPDCAEPFQTLAQIYEEKGDEIQTFQYLLIAANLCPSDGDGWTKVAEMAVDLGFWKLAISCYSKAIKILPKDISLHLERCRIYEKIGDIKRTIESYENIVKILGPTEGELALQLTKDIVKIHYNNGNIFSAIEVMESALDKHSSLITSEEVMFYVELLITNGQYVNALVAFRKHCGIKIMSSGVECIDLTEEILSKCDLTIHLMFATELPIDLRAKLVVTLINLRCLLSVNELLGEILLSSAEDFGDLYLDIIDAFMKMDLHEKAKLMAHKLLDSETYNEPSVWFRFAQCLEKTGETEHSIIAYSTVVRLAPNHFEARLRLSQLLISVGKEREALEISCQSQTDAEIDLELLQIRCNLLYSHKLWSEFCLAAKILLKSDLSYLKHDKELSTMITSSSYRTRLESLRDIHKELGLTEEECRPHKYIGKSVESEKVIEIFVKLLNVLIYKLKDFEEALRIAFSGYTCNALSTKQDLTDYYALMTCYLTKNMNYTYPLIKALIVRNIDNNQIWNIFCQVMNQFYQDLRHNRFCIRLFIKNPENIALAYFNGHNALMSGSYKHSLAEYVSILKQCPKEPFAAFSVCLAFVHLATQKFTSNRHSIVIQMCAFLDLYLELRGECQESFYNVGRAFHQLGIYSNAVLFYRKALEANTEITAKNKQMFDLKREIAYNLSLIYRNSGASDLALSVLQNHFVL